jgi:hypothetical protein
MNTLLATYFIAMLAIMAIVLSGKYFLFGLKLIFLKARYKGNVGLIFYRSVGNNFGLPKIVPLTDTKIQTNKVLHPFTREQFSQGLFFGMPFIFSDVEDVKTTYGLYKHQCDEKGEPLYWRDAEQKPIAPVLDAVKTSVSISPTLLRTAYSASALGEAINEFLNKNRLLLILCGGALLAGVIAAFFGYANNEQLYNVCTVAVEDLKGRIILLQNVTG